MKENQTNHYFTEWWERAAQLYVRYKSHIRIDRYYPKADKIRVYRSRSPYPTIEPAPSYLKEWLEFNPKPEVDRDYFIVALAKRVETLEAALAEKGCAK